MNQNVNIVSQMGEFFCTPLQFANQYADAGSFFLSRTLYAVQIISSIVAIVFISLGGIFLALKYAKEGRFKKSFGEAKGTPIYAGLHILVSLASISAMLLPLFLNRMIRGNRTKKLSATYKSK